jgi:uncharacterized membrane protein
MNGSEHRRLMDEIADWQGEGLITWEQAEKLRARYPKPADKNWALVVTGVFGALLVGLGIILLLAYNWDELNRPARALIAYLPLLSALAMCAWMIVTNRTATGLREGLGTFLALAVGASMALVAQTYQLGGTFRDLALAWMLLILPSVYVLDAVMPALIYLIGITGWAIGQDVYDDNPYWYWLLLAGLVPYLVWCLKRDRNSIRGAWLMWGMVLSLGGAVATGMHAGEPVLWFSLYAAFFASCLLAGELWGSRELTLWGRPLTLLGGGGMGVMVFLYSFIWFWEEMGRDYRYHYHGYKEEFLFADIGMVCFFMVLAVVLLVLGFRRLKGWPLRLAALFPPVSAVLVALNYAWPHMELVPAIFMNVYAFALGILVVAEAVRESRLGQMNLGLLLVAALLIARFFDADMSILGRGVAFILLGIGFLTANGIMIRRRRAS